MNNIIRCTNPGLGSSKLRELLYKSLQEKDISVYVLDEYLDTYNMLRGRCSIRLKLFAHTKDSYYIKSVLRHLINICNKRTKELQLNNCKSHEVFNNRFKEHMKLIRVLINQNELDKDAQNLLYYLECNCENVNIEIWKTEVGSVFRTSNDIVAVRESSIQNITEEDFKELDKITTDKNLTEKYDDEYIPTNRDFSAMNSIRNTHQKIGECVIFLGKRCMFTNNITDTNIVFKSSTINKLAIFSDKQTILNTYSRLIEMNMLEADKIYIQVNKIRNNSDVWKLQDNKDIPRRNHILLVNSESIDKSNLDYLLEEYSNKVLAFSTNEYLEEYNGDIIVNELILDNKSELFKRYDIAKKKEDTLSQLVIQRNF